jgi:ribonucleoside-triphosphate reductase
MSELRDTYGEEMFKLCGISAEQLDINRFAKKFFITDTVTDISSDPNANLQDNSTYTFECESNKSIHKLNAYYLLWKKLTDDSSYGIKRANKILELCISCALKIHDLHYFLKPYCYAFSTEQMVTKGFPFIKKVKIGPPKHFSSFVNLVIQLTSYVSNQMAGACSFSDLFVYMDYFARKDFGENYLDDYIIIKIKNKEYKISETKKLKIMNIQSKDVSFVTSREFIDKNLKNEYLLDEDWLK